MENNGLTPHMAECECGKCSYVFNQSNKRVITDYLTKLHLIKYL